MQQRPWETTWPLFSNQCQRTVGRQQRKSSKERGRRIALTETIGFPPVDLGGCFWLWVALHSCRSASWPEAPRWDTPEDSRGRCVFLIIPLGGFDGVVEILTESSSSEGLVQLYNASWPFLQRNKKNMVLQSRPMWPTPLRYLRGQSQESHDDLQHCVGMCTSKPA